MIKKLFFTILLFGLIALAVVYAGRNLLARRAIEAGSHYALGVETDLGGAGVHVTGGRLDLDRFEISNPEGFTEKHFLVIEQGMLDVDAGSVLDDEVTVDSLVLTGITLNLEQIDRKGNYTALLDHVREVDLGSASSGEQRFRIRRLNLRDISVEASLTLLGQQQAQKSFAVDNITLQDVGGDDGASVGEIAARVVKALVASATTAGSGLLPEGFGSGLREQAEERLDSLETEVVDQLKGLGKSLLDK